MKINTSNVSMSSEHSFYQYDKVEQETLVVLSSKAATIELSDDGKSKVEQLKDKKAEIADEEEKARKEREENGNKALMEHFKEKLAADKANKANYVPPTEADNQIRMMRKILELLNRITGRKTAQYENIDPMEDFYNKMNFGECNVSDPMAKLSDVFSRITPESVDLGYGGHTVTLNTWTKITATSLFHSESESMAYRSTGNVTTADGREITFNLTVEMSRSFTEEWGSVMKDTYTMVDPLVINLDNNCADVVNKTFMFDLDGDGKEEEVHELGKGSGFLALDKNGDGKINDGTELFGTKSGNGFKDLAAYDSDGNGWIDENDEIFDKLKIWTKDENGKDVLLSLKKADIGAICLSSEKTDFTIKNVENNATKAKVRQTGFFLKESSGAAGSVQHVDLAV